MANKRLHVAVGVIENASGQILIARRPDHVHQGGLWEFPGGKVESGETVRQALQRELHEELGIRALDIQPLIKIEHQYPDLNVLLDVWRIDRFSGQAQGCEGQAIQWVEPELLQAYDFPAANRPIICAAQLPDRYGILEGRDQKQVLANLARMFDNGVTLLQLRLKTFASATPENLLTRVGEECAVRSVRLLVNSDLAERHRIEAQGIHLSSRDLWRSKHRPEGYRWVAASCHNLKEIRQAEKIGVDFIVLAPVQKTRSHPETEPLGWRQFGVLALQSRLPVYALGGVTLDDLDRARQAGAQGIAGISAFR